MVPIVPKLAVPMHDGKIRGGSEGQAHGMALQIQLGKDGLRGVGKRDKKSFEITAINLSYITLFYIMVSHSI